MFRAAAFLISLAAPAMAQSAGPCDWRARAQAIAEPWEENTRRFANGVVRLAYLDTVEPAIGFAGLNFSGLQSRFDPAIGLIFDVPVTLPTTDGLLQARSLLVTVNQASGQMSVSLREPRQ